MRLNEIEIDSITEMNLFTIALVFRMMFDLARNEQKQKQTFIR